MIEATVRKLRLRHHVGRRFVRFGPELARLDERHERH
jgi:hypothetical protein